jgi:hypothetical protein
LEASTADEGTAEVAATTDEASAEIASTADVEAQVLPESAKERNELYIGTGAQEGSTSVQTTSKSTTSRDPS